MNISDNVGRAFARNTKAMSLKPRLAQGTATTRVRVLEDLRCEIEDGPWKLNADLGAKSGGGDTAPNPGVYGRTAIGTCLAMTYVMWATRLNVPLTSLEVEVQADYDSRGYHGVDDVIPGYEAIRYVVKVASDAPREAVLDLLDQADAHCDFLQVFARPQHVQREINWEG
jgi:uncharacterized OsmC-like protein